MTSAFYVTTKDFCKRAWLGALLAVGTLVLGPLFFVVLTRLQGLNLDGMEHDMTGYHFAYLGLSWIAFLAVSLQALSGSLKNLSGAAGLVAGHCQLVDVFDGRAGRRSTTVDQWRLSDAVL